MLSGPLVPRTVSVGQSDPYTLPSSVNGRSTSAGVSAGSSFPSYASIITASSVLVRSSPGFDIPAQVKTMNLNFVADGNLIQDFFELTIINSVPYFIKESSSIIIYDGLTDKIECRDAEGSNVLTILNKDPTSYPYPSWIT